MKIFKDSKKQDKVIDKTNIDYLRMNKRAVKLIETREERVKHCLSNCKNCIYREKEVGYCWYVMTTNKQNHNKDGFCSHFVDRETILQELRDAKIL